MNTEQNHPQQPQDNQQPYQNPATQPTPQPFSPEQSPVSPQPQYPYQPLKQGSKLPLLIIGGIVTLLAITVGMFLLLGGDSESQTIQTGNNQNPSVLQEEETEETALEEESNEFEISAQANQANTKHKTNLAKLIAAVSQYSANNNGKLPTVSDIDSDFISQYLNGQFNDPNTNSPYKIVNADPKSGEVQYKTSSTCGSDNAITAGGRRQVAVRVLLSDSTYHCTSN